MSSDLKKSDFFYDLPPELIAQHPAARRDESRMLCYERATGRVEHRIFRDLPDYLRPGDVLVLNRTRVLPARLYAHSPEGRRFEVLLLKRLNLHDWEALVRGARKMKQGTEYTVGEGLSFTCTGVGAEGVRTLHFHFQGVFETLLEAYGEMPLPPYITARDTPAERYQTVYARENGSAAAPTAGLHFTLPLLDKIRAMGVEIVEVLLHVGLGTFRPVQEEKITDHAMHAEYYAISEQASAAINRAKAEGRRVIAVGTTSVRALESAAIADGKVAPGSGETRIFIYPPYHFRIIDGLITNFHLPESTLIMLVSALIGREKTLELYRLAVEQRYRFFSYGDCCLFL